MLLYLPVSCMHKHSYVYTITYFLHIAVSHILLSWLPDYEEAVAKQGSVEVTINRNIIMGPPAVGKSCLKHLLVHNKPKEVRISTPIMEKPDVVSILADKFAVKGASVWLPLSDEKMVGSIRSSCLNRQYHVLPTGATPKVPSGDSHVKSIQPEIRASKKRRRKRASRTHCAEPRSVNSDSLQPQPSANPIKKSPFNEAHASLMRDLGAGLEEDLRLNGARFVHLLDTGGQPSFQDVLPLLLDIPCTYVHVFSAAQDLDQPVPITYRPNASTVVEQTSPETAWEMTLRSLTSVQTLAYKVSSDVEALPLDIRLPPFRTVLVGTFKDCLMKMGKVAAATDKISERIELLDKKPYFSYIVPNSDNRLFFLLNNLPHEKVSERSRGDQASIDNLRVVLSDPKGALKAKIPIGWFHFETVSRMVDQKFFPFTELLEHAKELKCVISANPIREFRSLLQLFHSLGVFTFLNCEDVSNTVCTDNSAFLREVSKLLAVDFVKAPKCHALKTFKKTGILSSDVELFNELGICKEVKPEWMLRCLCYLGVAACLSPPGDAELRYFMPAALPSEDTSLWALQHSSSFCGSVTPLLVAFQFRANAFISTEDMPRGIFARLAVELANKGWRPVLQKNTRLAIRFQCKELDICIVESAGYIHIFPSVSTRARCSATKLHEQCSAILSTLKAAIQASAQALFGANFAGKADAQFGFACPCGTPTHLAVQSGDSLVCNLSAERQEYLKSHQVWFSQVEGAEVSMLMCYTNIALKPPAGFS